MRVYIVVSKRKIFYGSNVQKQKTKIGEETTSMFGEKSLTFQAYDVRKKGMRGEKME